MLESAGDLVRIEDDSGEDCRYARATFSVHRSGRVVHRAGAALMARKEVVQQVDSVLRPLGLQRRSLTWSRRTGCQVDLVDLQISKSHALATVNVGVLDVDVHARCWGTEPPMQAPFCTVQERIGRLAGLKDLWWPLADPATPAALAEAVRMHVPPYLERMHSREAMAEHLALLVAKQHGPLDIINLAILRDLSGDRAGALSALGMARGRELGAWGPRLEAVSKRLGSAEEPE